MTGAVCSPVDGQVEVVDPGTGGGPARTVAVIEETEQVFAGHFPGFAIFPGVCVVEYVHRGALATIPAGTTGDEAPAGKKSGNETPGGESPGERAWDLAAIESSRFVSPVFPGDRLTTEYTWSRDGDGWRCRARAATERGTAAQVRLRYRAREA